MTGSFCLRRTGILTAFAVLVADLWTKSYIMDTVLNPPQSVAILSFFNLTPVWNYGVSFGLLASSNDLHRWALVAFTAIIAAAVAWVLWTAKDRLVAFSCGLIVGGAIGNIYDRVQFGAVRDFFDFHIMGWHWPAFNIADAAIVVGVFLLLISGLFDTKRRASTPISARGDNS